MAKNLEPVILSAQNASKRYRIVIWCFAVTTLASVAVLTWIVLSGGSLNSIFIFAVVAGASFLLYQRMRWGAPMLRCSKCGKDIHLDAPWLCGWCGTRHLTNTFDSLFNFRTPVEPCGGTDCQDTAATLICPYQGCEWPNVINNSLIELADNHNSGAARFIENGRK